MQILGFQAVGGLQQGRGGGNPQSHITSFFVTGNKSKDGEAHAAASRALKIGWFIESFGVEVIPKLRILLARIV